MDPIDSVIDITDQMDAQARARTAEESLARQLESAKFSEGRLRGILNTLSEGIVLMNREGRLIESNPAAEAILGVSRLQLLEQVADGQFLTTIRTDGTPYPFEQHPIARALETGRPFRNEVMGVVAPGAGLRWLSINAEPIFARNDPARPAFAVATFVDITEQRNAQEALRRSEARQALAIRGSREGVWDWDVPEGRVFYSEGWKHLLGYSGSEIGEGLDEWSGRVHPDDLEDTLRTVRDHLEGSTALYESEHRMRHKDGHYVWILDRGMVVERDASGDPKRVVGTHFDVSERKRMETELKEAKQELELALKAGKLGVSSRLLDGQGLSWDQRMGEMFAIPEGLQHQRVDHEFFRSRVHPDDWKLIDKCRRDATNSGLPTETVYRIVLPNGEIRHIHGMMLCPREPDSHRAIIVHRDVTPKVLAEQAVSVARRQAEEANVALQQHQADLENIVAQRTQDLADAVERARHADRAKTVFLATTGHELRTPLNSIIGFSQLLGEGAMGSVNEEQRRALAIINRSGKQQLTLVKDIIDFTIIESGSLMLALGDMNLRAVLEEQCEAAGIRARDRGLTIEAVECDAAISVLADKTRLEQVVRNLLTNALTFTDQGQVAVRARVLEGKARVEVQDSGIGIPADQIDRLFQPFTPIVGQPGPRRERTGLGLALCHRLVEAMGGTIGVDSTPGRGSTFWFTVPLSETA